MNRRSFLIAIPVIAVAGAHFQLPQKVNLLPKRIMILWSHRDNPERHGQFTWDVSCQRSYDQFTEEAVKMCALFASRNYDVAYRELTA
jgi:hypothetical protein